MEISEIFPHHLYSFHYDGQEENEFRRLFSEWNDIDYLLSFFRQYISFLDKDRRRGKCPWIASMQPNQNILAQRNSCPKKVLHLHHGKETFII